MEITYETIINYLTNNKNDIKKEEEQVKYNMKHIFTYIKDFSEQFNKLLGHDFYKCGVTVYDKNKINISFWTSLLTLLDKNFTTTIENDEDNIINNLKNQFLSKYNFQIGKQSYENDKNHMKEMFKMEPDFNTIQYVVDILDINIIIFDFVTNDIKLLYKDNTMNPWKQTLLFANNMNFWEPIMTSSKRLFDINNHFIKKIIMSNNLSYYQNKKNVNIMTNILDIIIDEKNKLSSNKKITIKTEKILTESEEEIVSTKDIFIKEDINDKLLINSNKLNKSKLNKMKIVDLTELSKVLGLIVDKKAKKDSIIANIMEKLKI